jgi:preprotein translocase subunit SecG
MTLLFTILILLVCILLTLVILVQNPKGGGLGQAFGGTSANMFGGVKKTTDFLDRSTWTLAIALFVLVLGMNMVNTGGMSEEAEESDLLEQVEDAAPLTPAPAQQTAPMGEDDLPENVEN